MSWSHFLAIIYLNHRRLRRLVAIELKIGSFKPPDAGQVELYLRWLDRHERQKGEARPIGLILCAGKNRKTVEVLELEPRGIHVAEYLTELPPRELLQWRLHDAVVRTRLRLGARAPSRTSPPRRGEELRVLYRDEHAYTQARRVADMERARAMYEAGGKVGHLWMEGFFDVGDPLVQAGGPVEPRARGKLGSPRRSTP